MNNDDDVLPTPSAANLERLVHVEPPTTAVRPGASLPRAMVVLDRSGSMSSYFVHLLQEAIPNALAKLGYRAQDSVKLILFDSVTEAHDLSLERMRKSTLKARGSTSIAPALSLARKHMESEPNAPFYVLVVSDGQVDDISALLEDRDKARPSLRTAPATVCLLRVMTSTYADPDTRALSAFGCLGQAGSVETCGPFREGEWREGLAQAFERSCVPVGAGFTVVGKGLRLLPGDVPAAQLTLNGPTWILCEDAGVTVVVEDDGNLFVPSVNLPDQTDAQLEPFLCKLERRVRQLLVVGGSSSRDELDGLFSWLQRLSDQRERAVLSDGVVCRAKTVAAAALKRRKGLLASLLELKNVRAVESLNSAQQAEFLRDVSSNRAGRGLAKRFAKLGSDDPEELAVKVQKELLALKQFWNHRPSTEPDPLETTSHSTLPPGGHSEAQTNANTASSGPISFYGQDSALGSISELAQLSDEEIEALSVEDALQLVGLGGYPAVVKPSAYPSPWAIKVQKVAAGDSNWLTTQDLCTAGTQAKTKTTGQGLKPPGREWIANAVVPVRSLDPVAWDLMHRLAPTVCSLAVSVCVRGTTTPMPFDESALAAAGALRALSNRAAREAMQSTIRPGFCAEVLEQVVQRGKDPRAVFTGEKDVVSSLIPVAWALLGLLPLTPQNHVASLAMDLRHVLKGTVERVLAEETLLGLAEDWFPDVGAPFSVDLPEPNDDSWKTDECLNRLHALVSRRDALDLVFERSLSVEEELALAVQALRSGTIARFVDRATEECLLPWILNRDDADAYLKAAALQARRRRYAIARTKKRASEEAILLERHLLLLRNCHPRDFATLLVFGKCIPKPSNPGDQVLQDSVQDQPEKLVFITGRSDPGYQVLEDSVLDQPEKLSFLLLGRALDDPTAPLWNGGNAMRRGFEKYAPRFDDAVWRRMVALRQDHFKHTYRSATIPNRHGHDNNLPSWWALGYNSPADFKTTDPQAFSEYAAARRERYRVKGRSLPSWFADLC